MLQVGLTKPVGTKVTSLRPCHRIQNAVSTCCIKMLYQHTASTCCIKTLYQNAVSKCCINMPYQNAVSTCCISMLYQNALSTCYIKMLYQHAELGPVVQCEHNVEPNVLLIETTGSLCMRELSFFNSGGWWWKVGDHIFLI